MRVGIVGGGITGLSLLHHLDARGVDAVCFEAADEPGGVIRTSTTAGRVLEHGPQRLRLSDPVAELVEAMELEEELRVADDSLPLYVYADGALRRVPRSIRSFLGTDLLSIPGKLRVLAEPLTAPGKPDETVAEPVSRKLGA
jgi:oxygen-dependent protoporphyrinogen oxidase